jgi:hypothetical protein
VGLANEIQTSTGTLHWLEVDPTGGHHYTAHFGPSPVRCLNRVDAINSLRGAGMA